MWPVDAEPYNCLSILLTEAASDRTTTCASQKSRFRTSLFLKKKNWRRVYYWEMYMYQKPEYYNTV